jgi:3-hydroxy-9,10-secoandrosta-1,3,5(10)-triene-9,17-dione monooxygenase
MQLRGQKRWNMNRGCEVVCRSLTELFHFASGRSIFLDHPLQRRFQDLHGALGHAYLGTDPPARSVGGALLGTSKPEVVVIRSLSYIGFSPLSRSGRSSVRRSSA